MWTQHQIWFKLCLSYKTKITININSKKKENDEYIVFILIHNNLLQRTSSSSLADRFYICIRRI